MTDVYCNKIKCVNNEYQSGDKKEFNLCCKGEVEITRDGNCFDYDESGMDAELVGVR